MTASRERPQRNAKTGYSLVEVLITLVIMALIVGLLFQGIGGAAQMSLRLSDEAERLDRNALATDWWRASLASSLPSAVDPHDPSATRPNLAGSGQTMEFETVASMHARLGAPRIVRWSLARNGAATQLVYESEGVRWTVATTRRADARFAYRDGDGAWKSDWSAVDPPQLVTLENFFDTPVLAHPRSRAVALQPPDRPTVGL